MKETTDHILNQTQKQADILAMFEGKMDRKRKSESQIFLFRCSLPSKSFFQNDSQTASLLSDINFITRKTIH